MRHRELMRIPVMTIESTELAISETTCDDSKTSRYGWVRGSGPSLTAGIKSTIPI
jgi:hypothetical protein